MYSLLADTYCTIYSCVPINTRTETQIKNLSHLDDLISLISTCYKNYFHFFPPGYYYCFSIFNYARVYLNFFHFFSFIPVSTTVNCLSCLNRLLTDDLLSILPTRGCCRRVYVTTAGYFYLNEDKPNNRCQYWIVMGFEKEFGEYFSTTRHLITTHVVFTG